MEQIDAEGISTDNIVFLIWVPFSLLFLLFSLVPRLLGWDAGRIRLLQASVYDSVCISLCYPCIFPFSY